MPPDSPLGTLADVSAPPGPAAQIVAEERSVFLPTRELALEVWLGEQRLSFFINGNRDRVPHIEQLTSAGVSIRLTDWVGRLPFRLVYEDSEEVQEVVVYPAKLSRTPGTAFAALARMVAELPELQRRLHFEGVTCPKRSAGCRPCGRCRCAPGPAGAGRRSVATVATRPAAAAPGAQRAGRTRPRARGAGRTGARPGGLEPHARPVGPRRVSAPRRPRPACAAAAARAGRPA